MILDNKKNGASVPISSSFANCKVPEFSHQLSEYGEMRSPEQSHGQMDLSGSHGNWVARKGEKRERKKGLLVKKGLLIGVTTTGRRCRLSSVAKNIFPKNKRRPRDENEGKDGDIRSFNDMVVTGHGLSTTEMRLFFNSVDSVSFSPNVGKRRIAILSSSLASKHKSIWREVTSSARITSWARTPVRFGSVQPLLILRKSENGRSFMDQTWSSQYFSLGM